MKKFCIRSLFFFGLLFLISFNSSANEQNNQFKSAYQKLKQEVEQLDHVLKPVFVDKLLLAESLIKRQSEDLKNENSVDREILVYELSQLLNNTSIELDILKRNMSYDKDIKSKTLSVKDFGAIGNGQHDDGPALRKAISALKTKGEGWRLWLPKGDYVVFGLEPKINYHLVVNQLDNCIIEGAPGTRIITSKVGGGIILDKCNNTRLKNITIDCRDQAPASQGTIIAVNKEDNTIDIQLDNNAVCPDQEYFTKASFLRGLAYDKNTESIVLPFIDPRIKWIKKVDDFYRLKLMNSQEGSPAGFISPYKVGHVFAIHARQTRGAGQALEIRDSEHIFIQGVTVNASFGIGIISNASDATKLIECKIERKKDSGRYWVSNADGIIVKDNRIGPIIYKCSVRHVNDDCINIHSSFYCAVSFEPAKENELLIAHQLGKASQPGTEYNETKFKQGDKLAIVNPNDGSTLQILTMKRAIWSEWKGQPALRLIFDQPLKKIVSRESLGKGDIDAREYVSGSETEVEHFVVNLNTKSNGFVIKDCFLGENRTKCILLKTGNGVISNNQLVLKYGIGIRMVGELNWMNGDACRNVIIKDNTIDANTSILSSYFLARKNTEVAVLNNSNITIENNVINSNKGIEIYYSSDVNIINNKIKSNPPQIFVDYSKSVNAKNNCLINKSNNESGVTKTGTNNSGNIILEKSKCD